MIRAVKNIIIAVVVVAVLAGIIAAIVLSVKKPTKSEDS